MIDLDNKEKYSKRVGSLSSNCSVLTASTLDDINQVFYANDVSSNVSATNLSVRYVTADDYHNLIAGSLSDDFEPKTLYIISSDQINAYNTQIINVGDPSNLTDAANKRWVEQTITSAITNSEEIIIPDINARLCADEVKIGYDATQHAINLSSRSYVTSVDCSSFIKDGMISGGQLCGTQLVLSYNSDASYEPLSIELSGLSSEQASNIFLSTVSADSFYGGRLDKLNLIKFDALSTYELCSNIVGLSDIALIEEGHLNAENATIISVADPIDSTDAANKRYVDQKFSQMSANTIISSFYEAFSQGGVANVNMNETMSAVYTLIQLLGYGGNSN